MQVEYAFSYVQFRISDISPCSPPKRQKTVDSVSTTSSFPLPYKPPSASQLASSESPSTAVSLTSQDIHSYNQPIPLRTDRGRALYGSGGDSRTVPASFRDAGLSESTLNTGHFQPQDQFNWQYSRTWPQDRIPRGLGYGTGRSPLNSHLSPRSDPSSRSSMELSFSPEKQNQSPFDIHPSRQHTFYVAEAELQRASQPPLSNSSDYYDPVNFSAPSSSSSIPICGSRHPSAPDANDFIRPIRETPYWPEMKDDPIFRDLSEEGPTVSIEELITRRNLALKNHVLRPVMNEKGTQTDFEAPSPAVSTRSLNSDHARTLETTAQTTQAVEATSRPNSRPANSFPRRRPNGIANHRRPGRNHSSETSAGQPRHRMRNLKRLRVAAEDHETAVDRQEAKINSDRRQRDNSVYRCVFSARYFN